MISVTAQAPAKVNLWLSVGAPADDGYHPLATVFHSLSMNDEVRATSASSRSGITLTVEGPGAEAIPLDSSNLAWAAAELIAEALAVEPHVNLHLIKRIPVAGGMAGGSADAAATLVACDALWGGELDRDQLTALAAALGSDVPFALHGGTAVGTGHGDRLTPVLARGEYHWVFAMADGGLSTPAVYRECDRLREGEAVADPRVPDSLMAALRAGDPTLLGPELGNDRQVAAVRLRPSLALVLEAGDDAGALGGVVSGSGPTCAFLASNREHALDIAARLSGSGTCRTVACASGPAAGARVIDQS